MKLILEIKDDKGPFIMDLLGGFSFVKTTPISSNKAQVLKDLKLAVNNLNSVKKGKIKAISAKDLYNEL